MSTEETFGNISLIGRGVPAPGAVRFGQGSISWKKTGGGRSVDVPAGDIETMHYSQVPGGAVVTVRRTGDKDPVKLKGFKGADLVNLKELCQTRYSKSLEKKDVQITGRNWGEVSVTKSSVGFTVDGKESFELNTKDIASVSLATKHEVVMEFHMDDAVKDALVEMSFYVPPSSAEWGAPDWPKDLAEDEIEITGAKNLQDAIVNVANITTDSGTPIAEFESVSLIAPRGKVAIELCVFCVSQIPPPRLMPRMECSYASLTTTIRAPEYNTVWPEYARLFTHTSHGPD